MSRGVEPAWDSRQAADERVDANVAAGRYRHCSSAEDCVAARTGLVEFERGPGSVGADADDALERTPCACSRHQNERGGRQRYGGRHAPSRERFQDRSHNPSDACITAGFLQRSTSRRGWVLLLN